ncbi:cytidine deaminase [Oligoflexia bacterium]|nr:cytidine deaminase [Oligoflexia bacterium]
MDIITFDGLNQTQQGLILAAEEVMQNAHSPFSKFLVGAALLTSDHNIVSGCNVENAAFGTICAERAAITRAVAMGCREFIAIGVISRGKDFDTTEVFGPCGACRQMIYEFSEISETNIEIIIATTKKEKVLVSTINELFPVAFGPKSLNLR